MIRFQTSATRKNILPLSDIQLRNMAPSVFATAPYTAVSDRYRFVPTSEVVDLLARA